MNNYYVDRNKTLKNGCKVLELEAQAITELVNRMDDSFVVVCEQIVNCKGRVIVTGMGKSGLIGRKIAATLASTGTHSFFVHPGEAAHGDLGMITSQDLIIMLSNSGETDELLILLPALKRLGVFCVALIGNANSSLSNYSDISLDVGVEQEACTLNLAPTSSTAAALAMGDALAVSILSIRGVTVNDFAVTHPAGSIGRRLLTTVESIMHTGDLMPKVDLSATLRDTVVEMTKKTFGMSVVVDKKDIVIGIFTDGDLRRCFNKNADINSTIIADIMTEHPVTCESNQLAEVVMRLMEQKNINTMVVVNKEKKLLGVLKTQDLIQAKII